MPQILTTADVRKEVHRSLANLFLRPTDSIDVIGYLRAEVRLAPGANIDSGSTGLSARSESHMTFAALGTEFTI